MNRILLVILTLATMGCTHEPFTPPPPPPGPGGVAAMTVFPQHHGEYDLLDSMIVYIKYGAKDAPADGIYDDSVSCTVLNSVPFSIFSGLNNGQYYFYAKGYDYYVLQRVKGGTGFEIKEQIADSLYLPVTEGGH